MTEHATSSTSRLSLTPLGEMVNRHSVMTDPAWWGHVWIRANKIADEDGEWEMVFTEMIEGLTEMRDQFYQLQEQVKP